MQEHELQKMCQTLSVYTKTRNSKASPENLTLHNILGLNCEFNQNSVHLGEILKSHDIIK